MSKFRFYVTDLNDGDIKGTNDQDVALQLSECEDYFVLDTDTGEWISLGERLMVKEFGKK